MPEPKPAPVSCPTTDFRNDSEQSQPESVGAPRVTVLDRFVLQVKQTLVEELHVVILGQKKIEELLTQCLKQPTFEKHIPPKRPLPWRASAPNEAGRIFLSSADSRVSAATAHRGSSTVPKIRSLPAHAARNLEDEYELDDDEDPKAFASNPNGSKDLVVSNPNGHKASFGSNANDSKDSIDADSKTLSERVARTLSAENKELRSTCAVRATSLENAMSSARKSVTDAFRQKTWMMSTAFQAKLRNQELDDDTWTGRVMCRAAFERIMFTSGFDGFFGTLIVLNAFAIGAEVEHNATHTSPAIVFQVLSLVFAAFFTIEFVIRFAANHMSVYFFGPDRSWNWFDFLMVIISFLEVVDPSAQGGQGPGSILRLVKMVRLFRIARVMRFVPQLRIMIFMILESVKSLIWLLIVLLTILYVFAIIFTMAGIESRDFATKADNPYGNEIAKHYGSVMRSLYSCLKAITSGQSWGELLDYLLEINIFYALIFLFYIVFSIFALFNIITGVFVDGALEKSQNDRDLVVQKELAFKKALIENLKTLFSEGDEDKSGTISCKELDMQMQDPRFESYLSHLSIDTSNINELFVMLDQDESGSITVEEFVGGMLHLIRGQTTEQSLRRLMKENRTLKAHLKGFMEFVEAELQCIMEELVKCPQSP